MASNHMPTNRQTGRETDIDIDRETETGKQTDSDIERIQLFIYILMYVLFPGQFTDACLCNGM